MKVYNEMSISEFDAWCGAVSTKERIIAEDKAREFDELIEELHPDGISHMELNDMLWFDSEWIFVSLGIMEEEE